MNYDENIYAEVVFDGVETHAPERMGTPKVDQLQGTTFERLAELAGRVCYDSLGKGRSSKAYHQHIAEVGHGSVWEHANFTVAFKDPYAWGDLSPLFSIFANRPGVWVSHPSPDSMGVTVNLRSVVEWDAQTSPTLTNPSLAAFVRARIVSCAHRLAPQIVHSGMLTPIQDIPDKPIRSCLAIPANREEKWVSLLLGGSRGMSHEQVRHKFRTAVSQRSTRYVDESTSPWVEHPLTTEWLSLPNVPTDTFKQVIHNSQEQSRAVYETVAESQQGWLESRGVDKHTSRKQARGAARGFLGNALATEMIFSASVAQWRRMLAQRCTIHADAEIRVLYGKVFQALKTTHWADDFADLTLVPSPDGIGEVLAREVSSTGE